MIRLQRKTSWIQRLSFFFVAYTCVTTTFAAVPSLTNPNIKKVSPHVYALIGDMDVPNPANQAFICNSVFVVTQTGVVVIDPGGSLQVGKMILAQIRTITAKPVTHVFNTHHHADHWMGNQAFASLKPRPKFLAHAVMRNTAAEIGERWITIIADLTKGANKGTKIVLPDTLVNGNETLKIGGMTFQLFHPAHAHTQGDIALSIVEERVLMAGDILFHQRIPGWQDASPLGNEKALQDFLKLEVDQVIPGHGPVTDKMGITAMLDYIQLLRKEVKHYLAEGLADFEMKDKIEMGPYRALSGFKDRFGINVNRMYLEVEAEAFGK